MGELKGSNQDLRRRVAVSALWLYGSTGLRQGLGLVRTVILARLLTPEAFGVVAIATVGIGLLDTFSNTGFRKALIQRPDLDREHMDTAWVVSVARGLLMFVVLVASAGLISRFYEAPNAEWVIRIIGISVLLNGLNNIGTVSFARDLRFDRLFIYQGGGLLVNFLITVGLAFVLRDERALVFGIVSASATTLVLSYVLSPYRPRIHFDKVKAKQLFSFGVWVFASGIMVFFARQGDRLVIPKLLSVSDLGLYTMAFTITTLVSGYSGVVQKVLFPAYSKLQHDRSGLKSGHLAVIRLLALIAIPLSLGLALLASPGVSLVLGERWGAMVPALQILALSTMVKVMFDVNAAVFNATGRPDLTFRLTALRAGALAGALAPFILMWGIAGAAAAVLVSSVVGAAVAVHGLRCEIKVGLTDYAESLGPPAMAAGLMCAVVHGMGLALDQQAWGGLLTSVVVGATAYLAGVFLLRRFFGYQALDDVYSVLRASQTRPASP